MAFVVPCVGAIVRDERGRLLLIRRARPPAAGSWSLPGGRVETGEVPEQAVVREVAEETGLTVTVETLTGRVRRDGPGGVVYDIVDYTCHTCHAAPGLPRAGDDAVEVGWFPPGALESLGLSPGLLDALREWGVVD